MKIKMHLGKKSSVGKVDTLYGRRQVHSQRGTRNFGPGSRALCAKKLRMPLTVVAFFGSFFSIKERTWKINRKGGVHRMEIGMKMKMPPSCPSSGRVDASGLASRRVRTITPRLRGKGAIFT
jgi:hypothetical protein